MVVAEHLLVKVAKQMEWFDTDVGSSDAALEQAPEVFESVGVNLAINVFLGMVNYLVGVVLSQPVVRLERIGVESSASFDVLFDSCMESAFLPICDYYGTNLSATFQCAEHDGLVFSTSASNTPLAFVEVHVASLAPDEGFVNLDFASEFATAVLILHDETDAVKHEPRRLLSNLHVLGNLVTADAVLAVSDEPSCCEPLVQRDCRIFHHSSDLDRKLALQMMTCTLPHAAGGIELHALRAASWTSDYAVRPTADGEIVNAVIGIREVQDCFLETPWFAHKCLTYNQIIAKNGGCVKEI